MNNRIPPKRGDKSSVAGSKQSQKPAVRAPSGKTGRVITNDNAPMCFDGAGELNPTTPKGDKPKGK